MRPEDLLPIFDGQLKKMLAYIAADISALFIQFQIFLNLLGRSPWERLSLLQAVCVGLWAVGSWAFSVAATTAIIVKFHELVYLESRLEMSRFYDSFRPKRSHIGEVWDRFFKGWLSTEDEDVESDRLWQDPTRVLRMKYRIDLGWVVCLAVSLVFLSMNLALILSLK